MQINQRKQQLKKWKGENSMSVEEYNEQLETLFDEIKVLVDEIYGDKNQKPA